jgi:hypothetical protein
MPDLNLAKNYIPYDAMLITVTVVKFLSIAYTIAFE